MLNLFRYGELSDAELAEDEESVMHEAATSSSPTPANATDMEEETAGPSEELGPDAEDEIALEEEHQSFNEYLNTW